MPIDARLSSKIEFGNAGELNTNGTGWIIGFSPWSKPGDANLRHIPPGLNAKGLCVKWFMHEAGNPRGEIKPISQGRTISLLVGQPGEFKLEFSLTESFKPGETLACVLREPGDFAVWGEGIYHRWYCGQPSSILTIRWQPEEFS